MPTKIQLKRGLKANLPTLSSGEAAFTTDSKELFVGDGTSNYNMTPAKPNLIVNGNFQVALPEDLSGSDIVLAPGQGRYIYGFFYLYNDNTATGNIVLRYYNNPDVPIQLTCTNAKPYLDYRGKVSRIQKNPGVDYLLPYKEQDVTLSMYLANWNSTAFSSQWGLPSNLQTISIPSGVNTFVNSFPLIYAGDVNGYKMLQVVLLKINTAFTGTIVLGKIKLEPGKGATPFYANSIQSDVASIDQVYKYTGGVVRVAGVSPNLLRFWIPNTLPFAFNYQAIASLLSFNINDVNGNVQTGFTLSSIAAEPLYQTISIQMAKNNHGLTDAIGSFQVLLDARPQSIGACLPVTNVEINPISAYAYVKVTKNSNTSFFIDLTGAALSTYIFTIVPTPSDSQIAFTTVPPGMTASGNTITIYYNNYGSSGTAIFTVGTGVCMQSVTVQYSAGI